MVAPDGLGIDDAETPDHDVRVHTIDWLDDGLAPSYSVTMAVSKVTETPVEELQPLYDVVDPDALDELFDRMSDTESATQKGHLRFGYEGCDVTVYADGRTVALLSDVDTP
ncbi:HalOD1 output domain-containing protein [Natronomonas amylolytica]|uniref:HalOD1 output domain-containing protein n=1 Tax=Natronomonas amylolytica TaxID=3108498 RepID=UPI003009B70E